MMNLLSRIERYLRKGGMTQTQLGRALMNDPGFIRSLRKGREPRPETRARIVKWLEAAERALKDDKCAG